VSEKYLDISHITDFFIESRQTDSQSEISQS